MCKPFVKIIYEEVFRFECRILENSSIPLDYVNDFASWTVPLTRVATKNFAKYIGVIPSSFGQFTLIPLIMLLESNCLINSHIPRLAAMWYSVRSDQRLSQPIFKVVY